MCANSMRKLCQLERKQLAKINARRPHSIYGTIPFVPYPRMPKLAHYVATYGADDIRTTAHLWHDSVSFIRERRDDLAALLEVRYEDILANPASEVFRILEFCELAPVEQRNGAFWKKIKQVGVLHHRNSYSDFDVIDEICGDSMREFGYVVGEVSV
jgi:hypothetical protein